MGHNKSKLFEPENLQQIRHLHDSKEERRKRRKWRKKQGYSLPSGMDSIGGFNGKTLSAASSHTDLPDCDQDDAILVSYSKSNAEKFSHLRPQFQRFRSSSEEPSNIEQSSDLVQVIHINDCKEVTPENTKKTIINLNSSLDEEHDQQSFKVLLSDDKPLDEDEEILNVIEDSFKRCYSDKGQRNESLASPKLEPEDIDLLNALMSHDSLVPEPSVVIPEKVAKEEDLQVVNHDDDDNKELKNIEEATPPPPSPYASTSSSTTDVQPISNIIDEVISDNDNSKSDNEINEDLEVKLTSIPNEKRHHRILKDLDESANLIDDFDSQSSENEPENEVFAVFRPQIDCDVLNSIIEEENDEDIQSNVSSLVLDKIVPMPKKESEEILVGGKNSNASTDKNNVEKVEVKNGPELFSVSAKIIPDPNYNGKETDVDDDDDDDDDDVDEDGNETDKDLYHSTLVTTCVDSDEDNTEDNYDLEVPNESWTSYASRPQPVGCSSDSPSAGSTSSSSSSSQDKDDHYDSLEDEPKQSKRSLPPLPKDHDLQQKRAYEIFRQHWVPSVEERQELISTPVNEPLILEDNDDHRLIEGRNNEDNEEFYNYHLNLPAKRQLPKPPPVSPLIFDKDSGCASLENNHQQQQKRNSPEPPNFLWVGLEDSKEQYAKKKQPKNHERLNATKKKLKPKNKDSKSRIHSAVVSGINIDTRSVTVEWFERGETKGKEVELETLLSLNQDLAPVNNDNNATNNKLGKSDRSVLGQTRSYVPRPSVTPSNRSTTTTAAVAGSTRGGRGGGNKVRQTMNGLDIQQQNSYDQHHEKQQQNGGSSENVPPARGETKQQHQTSTIPPEKMETVSKGTGANRRRSNVVKEIDRLKKNREERRAKQQEILEEKSAKQSDDPGNPNWEFLCMIRDYQEQLDFNPLNNSDDVIEHQITVCVRKRPVSKKEKIRKEIDVITCPNKDQAIVHEPKTKVDLSKYLDNQHFRYDYVFDDSADNQLVYKYTARPLVQNIFEGGRSTCFAYGQTGSGKTHTMGGEFHGKTQDSKNGIYALATKDVFKYLTSPKYKSLKLQVSCSYFEIYSGKVFDLLSGKSKLRVLEDGKQQVQVVGLTETVVESVEDVLKLITSGNNLRTSGQTSANQHSSRSHAVFQIILRNATTKKLPLYGKFSLIDLAGNERGADTSSANRQTRMEGAEINKSLLALKECIRALGRKGGHLPFRASKLTQVLRDSFIGDKSKTCMIAMVSPGLSSCEHTLNTLRYADRVKELGAADPVNQQPKSSPTDGPEGMRMDDGVMSPEDSDLAQLRSLNEGELSADWYNFQEAISHLQALEDELVESHRGTIQNMLRWTKDDASLLAMTNEVDYDQDAYCQQLEDMISEKIEAFHDLREKARNFRTCLRDEEAKSRLLMHRN